MKRKFTSIICASVMVASLIFVGNTKQAEEVNAKRTTANSPKLRITFTR